MRYSAVRNCRLALLLFLAVALLVSGCVKLPRRMAVASDQTRRQVFGQETASASLVNINTASRGELERLPGIGPALAARIVAHREQYGRFRRAEHLIMVRGISDRRFRALRQFITVE